MEENNNKNNNMNKNENIENKNEILKEIITNKYLNMKLFQICHKLFPKLTKKELKYYFKLNYVYINNIQLNNGINNEIIRIKEECEVIIIRNKYKYDLNQLQTIKIEIISYNNNIIIPLKLSGINGGKGRKFDEIVQMNYDLISQNENNNNNNNSLHYLYRLPKNIGGLCLIGTTFDKYVKLREMLCNNIIQISYCCIVVGKVGEVGFIHTITFPVHYKKDYNNKDDNNNENNNNNDSENEEDNEDDNEDDNNNEEEKIETQEENEVYLIHELKIEVLRVVNSPRMEYLSLIKVTPLFLREFSERDSIHLLKPSTTEDYQYLHYPTSVLKAIPKALRLAGYLIIGGERELIKKSKGLYHYLNEIYFDSFDNYDIQPLLLSLLLNSNNRISVPLPEKFKKLLDKEEEEYQHILSSQSNIKNIQQSSFVSFFGLNFFINSDVMIPRLASEILVQKALEVAKDLIPFTTPLKILDMGTGSGSLLLSCINSLKSSNISCLGVGIDICQKALSVAKVNVEQLSLVENITLLQHSFSSLTLLYQSLISLSQQSSQKLLPFDIILCNPPYSSIKDARLSNSNRRNEPSIALYADHINLHLTEESLNNNNNNYNNNNIDDNLTQIPSFHKKSSHESLFAFKTIARSFQELIEINETFETPFLLPHTTIIIEFGSGQMEDVQRIFLETNKFDVVEILLDQRGIPRCIVLKLKK